MIFNNTPCTASHLRARTGMQGLTLVEILVSAVLGALMLVALMGFVGAANKILRQRPTPHKSKKPAGSPWKY